LITSLKKDGILLLNRDNEMIMSLKENAKHITYTYGMDANADVSISNDSISYERDGIPSGVNFRINYEGNSLPVHLEGVFGRNHIYSALIALAVTHVEKLNMLQAIEALKDYEIAPGRMRLLEGEKGTYIIDDTYNASPIAMQAALHTLQDMKVKGRKIAVLGDMLELGRLTEESHKEIGALAQQSADVLVVVGKRASHIAEGAIEAGYNEERIFKFDTADQAKTEIEQMIHEGDIILVKGSQGMRMEKIVEEIMAHPELKEKLLVRQEEEWRNR
jgi:UDP-N-acetylmuramoyl-tripeptide--D-alanyl-D-alanine ligase